VLKIDPNEIGFVDVNCVLPVVDCVYL